MLYLEADLGGLERLARLLERATRGVASASELAEIRHLEDRFGLSPLGRWRLRWELQRLGVPDEPPPGGPDGDDEDGRWLRVADGDAS